MAQSPTPKEYFDECDRWIANGDSENDEIMELPFEEEVRAIIQEAPLAEMLEWITDAARTCPSHLADTLYNAMEISSYRDGMMEVSDDHPYALRRALALLALGGHPDQGGNFNADVVKYLMMPVFEERNLV